MEPNIRFRIAAAIAALLAAAGLHAQEDAAVNGPANERVGAIVSRMTLEEKCNYVGAARSFVIGEIERLGLPQVRMADGPQGVRNNTVSTLYPCGIMSAATWNRSLVEELGHGLGRDSKARGVAILLGPGVNIYRAPMCGRNFEYFGEDPYLASEVAKHYILGVQDEGVIATIKHFAANNQEWDRHHASSDVDERTMHEIYFPTFRKAVQQAHVGAVMNSYNPVFGVHASENAWMNIDVLRDMWGFDGILMSDWTSVYSSSGAANGGLDLECPDGVYFNAERLVPLVEAGVVSEAVIDRKVYHILNTLDRFGLLDKDITDTTVPLDNPANADVALRIAREGAVLLENRGGELPFGKKDKVLVVGPNATKVTTGGGSGFVTPFHAVSLADALVDLRGAKNVTVISDSDIFPDCSGMVSPVSDPDAKGFDASYFNGKDFNREPAVRRIDENIDFDWGDSSPADGIANDCFSCRWDGIFTPEKSGKVRFVIGGDDGYRLFVDDNEIAGDWADHSFSSRQISMDVEAGKKYRLRFEFFDNYGNAAAKLNMGFYDDRALMSALKKADRVVFCAGFDSDNEGEGFDRTFGLPDGQVDLIRLVAANHDHVTVVLNAGGAVDFRGWGDEIQALLMAWHSGQEGGTAIAEIISGITCPSGKLPISMENAWEDNPVHDSYYDNTPVRTQGQPYRRVEYSEGIFSGYRGYDRKGISPRYPFGYGLSYTTFEYSSLVTRVTETGTVKVGFDITNTGAVDAFETAQIYVSDEVSSVPRPVKELKGFEKVFVKKGKTVSVELELDREAFAFFDIETKAFKVEPGRFVISVGPSSASLPLKAEIEL